MSQGAGSTNECVLVVDDDAELREALTVMLGASGYDIIAASNAAQAVELFSERQPALVLLDVLMPDADGFAVLRQIRGEPGGVDVAVVMMTALGDQGTRRRAVEAGADDFLTKPIQRADLLVRVRSAGSIGRLRAEVRRAQTVIRAQLDALERAQQQRKDLAALLMHDLKNPLTTCMLNAQVMLSDPSLSGVHREQISEIKEATDIIHRMLMDMLDIELTEDGQLVPQVADANLAELVNEVVGAMRLRATEEGVSIQSSVVAEAVANVDRDLVRRLVANLVDNAIAHAPTGTAVGVDLLVEDGYVELRISDEGSGVPEPHRERIFDKYARIDNEPRSGGSHGLGLTFCRLAAEVHGGRIWVEDNEPRGARFCVKIPVGT